MTRGAAGVPRRYTHVTPIHRTCHEIVGTTRAPRMTRCNMRWRTPLIAFAVLVVPTRAHAVACDALGGPPVVWIENGDTQEPLLKRLGKQLVNSSGTPVRIVYRNRPTCELADNFYNA